MEVWRDIIEEGEEKLKNAGSLKEREIEEKINKEMEDKEMATVLTGVRRAGKSSIALRIGKEKSSAYINFEDERLIDASIKDLSRVSKIVESYDVVILDEVQNIVGWEKFVNRMLGKVKFIITGSNSSLLHGKFSSSLVGRKIEHVVMPFSFREYKKYSGRSLFEYIREGGFPKAVLENRGELSKEYIKDIFYRDITQKVKDVRKAQKVFFHVISNPGITATLKKIKNLVKISTTTLEKYVDLFIESYAVIEVELYRSTYRYRKLYPIDNGIAKIREGRAVEALVAQELFRRGNKIEYYKEKDEIDFIVGDKAIQVCYDLNEENFKREVKPLLKWKGKRILIAFAGFEKEVEGVEIVSLERFLKGGQL